VTNSSKKGVARVPGFPLNAATSTRNWGALEQGQSRFVPEMHILTQNNNNQTNYGGTDEV
jgi:hypothetical protein